MLAFELIAFLLATCSRLCKCTINIKYFYLANSYDFRTKKILDDNPDLKRQWTSLIPQGKMGQPEDLMGAVTFLSSDASGYVTGADLRGSFPSSIRMTKKC